MGKPFQNKREPAGDLRVAADGDVSLFHPPGG
jgi:hypothetical protein